ncbi:hypothetical protein [Nocardia sp. NPDC058497]|uniref:hypothetical protein n=1 Tax=Nocardia sp. NPDC058497 TaxID=3346529 RepID=UPI0036630E96
MKCEWRGGDTTVQIGLWEYEKAPTANASFTNLLMLCPGEEIEPIGISKRSAYCGRKVAPACNLIANQGVFHIDVIWTAPAGTDEKSCRSRASTLGGEVSRLLG